MLKKISELSREEPFSVIFPINPLDLQTITDHMRKNGYDEAQPIVVWKGQNLVVDGFTRIAAAIANGIESIPVVEKDFNDEIAAIKYTVHLQRDRRNLTPMQFTKLLQTIDQRLKRGGDRKSKDFKPVSYSPLDDAETEDAIPNGDSSAELTADILGVSPSQVNKTRKIIDSDDPEAMEMLEQGASINKVHQEIVKKEKVKKEKESTDHKFIKVSDNKEWAGWVFNPIVGCKQGCEDCVYKEVAESVYDNFEPQFFPERFQAIKNTKVSGKISPATRNVLLCEMGDMLNPDIPFEWIEQTVEALFDAPQWNFVIRTKFPERFNDINWPNNTWLGAVVTNQAQADHAGEVFKDKRYKNHTVFLSCYPLRSDIVFKQGTLSNVNWIIIGATTATDAVQASQPEWNWIENILWKARENNCKVFFMNNIKVVPKEIPEVYIQEVIQKNIEI